MAVRRRNLREDLAWLKWWLVALPVSLVIAIGGYRGGLYFRGEMSRLEINSRSNFDAILQEVAQIEESEQIIVDNIDRFNSLVEKHLLDAEDRISLLEDIRRIRENFGLFPIDVGIREQTSLMLDYEGGVEFPEESISIRSSLVTVGLPLLHEEDLSRFLDAFLNAERLMVTTSCTITVTSLDPVMALELVPHQMARCGFIWYTFAREPQSGNI
jgi:hypothetical protein